jgi:hypothetical protein
MFAAGVASGQFDEPGVKLYDARDTEMRNARADEGFDGFEFMLLPGLTLTPRLVSHEFFNDQQIGFALWCFLTEFIGLLASFSVPGRGIGQGHLGASPFGFSEMPLT